MFRLIKFLFYFVVLIVIGLLVYAYLGPLLGADFSAPQTVVTQPLELSTE